VTNLAISNIAWSSANEEKFLTRVPAWGFTGLEIAPARYWPEPAAASDEDIQTIRDSLRDRGLPVVAMQALLFGRPQLKLFASNEIRRELILHIKSLIRIGGKLGARALVFGSPKNRIVGGMPRSQAQSIATEFFRELGDFAAENGTSVCVEANPAEYGGDYLLSFADTLDLTRRVNSAGLRVQLDVSSLILNAEHPESAIDRAFPWIGHVHASAPFLDELPGCEQTHRRVSRTLRRLQWRGPISLEMREPPGEDKEGPLERSARCVWELYSEVWSHAS
jgi:D-psicose/D-tagatose/L-ribulose 3-epimerase